MAAASSRARISWPCATKFERPNLILWRSHEIRSFDDHNTEASPGNCGGATTSSGLEIPERFVGPYLHVDGVDSPLVVE